MSGNKRALGSDLNRVDAHQVAPEELDETPELTEEWFARAQPHVGGRPVRRGRPPKAEEERKVPVKLRIDRDVVDRFKATGPGWQTRINDALRKAADGL